uniref:tectonic-2-like n=1 Tax=Ciona intestinalis TaxID=7719 RepID=UPI000180C2E9|nr:tectonic-2-like [Ciona intestinalis]|eukprot:XP_026693437.1 tectonic-2-like [Ciona intestinalis]
MDGLFTTSKLLILLLITKLDFTTCQSNLQLIPSAFETNVGHFSLVLQGTSSNVACSISGDSNWVITTPTLTVASSATVNGELTTPVTTRLVENIVVSCNDSTSTATSNVAVDISPDVTTNSTSVLASTVTIFNNPAFEDIAPCTCKEETNQCTINCCCDPSCTADQISTFQCVSTALDDPNLCSTTSTNVPDYHQFTCIQFLNSPLLGLYFTNFTGSLNTVSTTTFTTRAATPATNTFSFKQTTSVQTTPITPYTNGDRIQTQSPNGFLTFPQNSLSGQCIQTSYVRYQNDTSAVCVSRVTSATCAAGTLYDVNYYLKSSSIIAATPGGSPISPNITFICGNQTNYLKTSTAASTPFRSFFDASNPVNSATPCTNTPGTPIFSAGSCDNAVVDVSYIITWNSSSITQVLVTITVANLVTSANDVLSQKFETKFEHSSSAETIIQRSGNPGYNIGYPIISASVFESNINQTQTLLVWSATNDGLCSSSLSSPPLFGKDSLTGCLVRLSYLDFKNCSVLQSEIEAQQRSLLSASYVSRFGNPNTTALNTDWIQIIDNLDFMNTSSETVPGQCFSIPAHVIIEFMMSQTGTIEGAPIFEVVGSRISWSRVTWQMSCSVNQACQTGTSLVENFEITSSVTFTEVNRVQSSPMTLSQLDDSASCAKDATCWGEVLLPLTPQFYLSFPITAAMSAREENIAWALVVIFFSVGAALLSFSSIRITK